MTTGAASFTTTWTGAAANGQWNDPGNWTNGVPPSGVPVANGANDTATIDNSIETTPFTVTIAGSAVGDTVTVNTTDPAGAPSVSLTGTLDLTNNVQPGSGGGLGTLNLDHGTFEVDGGTLKALTVEQGGEFGTHNGALTFGSAATVGADTLDAVGVQNEFTIGNASDVVVKSGSFAIFEKDHGANQDTVTINGGSTLDIEGALTLGGVLDIKNGAVTLGDSGSITGESGFHATVFADGGTFTINGSGSLDNATVEGNMAVVATAAGPATVTVADKVTLENAPGAAQMAADLGGNTLDVTGTLDLLNADIKNGTIRVESGATLALDPTALANGFGNLTIDGTASAAPVVIDLAGNTIDVAGPLSLRNIVLQNGTLAVENGASINLDGTSSLNNIVQQQAVSGVDDLGGQTLDVTSALILRNGTIANGTVKVENGATVAFDPAATTVGFDSLTIDATASASPVTIDLGGRTIEVSGALNLDNVILQNGTIDLAINASINPDGTSSLINVTQQQVQTLSGGTTTTLSGTPDVHITAPTNFTLVAAPAGSPATELDVNTGTGGTPGTFFVDSGAQLSGAGLVRVSDQAGGTASTEIDGTVTANVAGQALHLDTVNWILAGALDATNGGTLEVGDASSLFTSGAVATIDAGAGSTVQLDSGAPITGYFNSITLDGAGSTVLTGSPGSAVSLDSTLTSIGLPDANGTTYSNHVGGLSLLDGRSLATTNALSLYGTLNLGGGTLTAPSITGHFGFIGGGSSAQLVLGTIEGFGTVDASLSSVAIDASGGTLTLNGSVSVAGNVRVEPNAGLVFSQDAPGSASFTVGNGGSLTVKGNLGANDVITLGDSATLIINGNLGANTSITLGNNDRVEIDGTVGTGETLTFNGTGTKISLKDGLGLNLTVKGTPIGNSIDLVGTLPADGSTVELAPTTGQDEAVVLHPSAGGGSAANDDTITIVGGVDTVYTQADFDGQAGTLFNLSNFLTSPIAFYSTSQPGSGGSAMGGTGSVGDPTVQSGIFGSDGTIIVGDPQIKPPAVEADPGAALNILGQIIAADYINNPGGENQKRTVHFTLSAPSGILTVASNDFTLESNQNPVQISYKAQALFVGRQKVGTITMVSGFLEHLLPGSKYINEQTDNIDILPTIYGRPVPFYPKTVFYFHPDTNLSNVSLEVDNVNGSKFKTSDSNPFLETFQAHAVNWEGDLASSGLPSPNSATGIIASGQSDKGITFQVRHDKPGIQNGAIDLITQAGVPLEDPIATKNDPAPPPPATPPAQNTSVPVQIITNDYAKPNVDGDSDPKKILTVELGTFQAGTGPKVHDIFVENLSQKPADDLGGSFAVNAAKADSAFSLFDLGVSGIHPQQFVGRAAKLTLDTTTLGDHSEGIIYTPVSINPDQSTNLPTIQVIYHFKVIGTPAPPAPPPPQPTYKHNPTGGASGDPHLTTFDGLHYDFQAAGEFVLAKSVVAGDNFEVQVRTVSTGPGSHVSVIHEAGIAVGTHRVTVDTDRTNALWIDGSAVTIGGDGTLNLTGGGSIRHIGSGVDFQITTPGGETATVSYAGVTVQLGTSFPAGQVEGLLGNDDQNFNNDLQLADGSHPGTSLTFGQLYTDPNSLANAWRVTQATSLLDYGTGQTTATFTDPNFPPAPITLADLPSDVVARATTAVDAAGVTDPVQRANAILDYALTGDQGFIQSALTVQDAGTANYNANLTVTNAPPPPATTATIQATSPDFFDSTAATFEIDLSAPLATDVTVTYAVVDPGFGGFLNAASFGGTLPTGTVTISAGQTSGIFSINVPGIGSDVSDNLRVAITGITTADGSTAPTALVATTETQIVNSAPTEGVDATAGFLEFSGGGTFTQNGNAWTLDLGNLLQSGNAPRLILGVENLAGTGGNPLTGSYAIAADPNFTIEDQTGPTNLIAGGVAHGLQILADNGTLGQHSETVTLNATQNNVSGFTAALAPITLTITDDVVAPPPPTLTPVANETIEATGSTGAAASFSASATDVIDGIDPVVFKEGTTVVTSGETFALGTHTITASATDSGGRTSSETFTITVQDTTPPTLSPVANRTVEATGPNGALVSFPSPTATDLVDGADPVIVTPASGTTFSLGAHTITATATDKAGNTATESFTITVVDTTPPTLTPIANETLQATGPNGAVATFTATASDLVDGTDTVVFREGNTPVHSGDTFSVGTHTITASSTDAAGNTASENFTITVKSGPTVASVVASPPTGDLGPGTTVTFTVTMSTAVKVGGITKSSTPFLTLNDGGVATYKSGSGTNALTFVYRVGGLGSGQDTSSLAVAGFNPNGATITDAAKPGVAADLSGVTAFTTGPQIDTIAPAVTSIVASGGGITGGNGDLNAGKTVTLTVSFGEPVTVNATGGTPFLRLNDGGTAGYVSGSGTNSLTFTYTVATGQNTADLAVTALVANGGTVADGAGNKATFATPAGVLTGTLQIDTRVPVVTERLMSDTGVSRTDLITSDAALVGTGDPNATVAFTVDGAPIGVTATADSHGKWSFTPSGLADGSHTVVASETDGAGNTGTASLTFTLDTTAPTVTGVLENPSSGDLDAGKTVTLTVNFDTAVYVTGTPYLKLNDGGRAIYATGSGTNQLTFTYLVAAGQNTPDLAVTGPSAAAAFRDIAGNVADLSALVLPGNVQIDTLAPKIASIVTSGPAIAAGNGDLGPGSTVTLTVNFSEAVVVDTSGGSPTLALNDGGTAIYTGGSNSSALTFAYTVGALGSGENTPDLALAATNAFSLNGAAIMDNAGNAAVLIGANKYNPAGTLAIDTTAPTVTKVVSSPATGEVTTGHTARITLDMSEAVGVSGSPVLELNDGGTASFDAAHSSKTALAFDYVVGAEQTTDLVVSGIKFAAASAISDPAGNAADLSGAGADIKLQVNTKATGPAGPSGGNYTIGGGSDLVLLGRSNAAVTFAPSDTATLQLDSSSQFGGTVGGFALGDRLDLADIAFKSLQPLSYTPNSGNTAGSLGVTDGTHSASIALLGQYFVTSFVAASDGHGGTLISEPPPVAQSALVQPHA